jgi:hypothetical protein
MFGLFYSLFWKVLWAIRRIEMGCIWPMVCEFDMPAFGDLEIRGWYDVGAHSFIGPVFV